jgi:hypothetical protein
MNGVQPTTVSGLVQIPSVTLDQWQKTTPQKETPAVVRWQTVAFSQPKAQKSNNTSNNCNMPTTKKQPKISNREQTPRVPVLHHRLGVDS